MRSYYIHSESWQNRNDRLQSVLNQHYGLKSGVSVRVFPHLELALYELTQGTCFFYAHKKSLCLQMGSSPLISHFQKLFLREGFQVQTLTSEQFLQTNPSWDQWAQEVKKDTCLCLLQADHPILDQKYNLESFLAKCEEKKIYCVILHHQSLDQKLLESSDLLRQINPYSVHVFHWDLQGRSDLTVALCGERFKTPSLIVDQIESISFVHETENKIKSLEQLTASKVKSGPLAQVVQKRETEFPHFYQQVPSRQYRQLMIGTKNSSDFVFHQLIAMQSARESLLFCPSLCLHQLTIPQFQWWKDAPDLAQLKHLLVVDVSLVSDEKFWEDLRQIDATLAPTEFAVQV